MKRIVNGVTYNTDTSTLLAKSRWESDNDDTLGSLYQTRGGAFFVDMEISRKEWNESEREYEVKVGHTFQPLSPEDAHKWLLTGEVEVFSNPFEDPPEAAAEAEPGATIYIRVPASLKRRVDHAAEGEKVSGNVWAMRCVERCLTGAAPAIKVVHVITGEEFSAEFVRNQVAHEGRYEILFKGKKWTVGRDNIILGPTEEAGQIAPDYEVRLGNA
jgi:hypothetical protein